MKLFLRMIDFITKIALISYVLKSDNFKWRVGLYLLPLMGHKERILWNEIVFGNK